MARTVFEYRALLISPGDLDAERGTVATAISDWNAHIGDALGARVEVVRWETHARPDASEAPQAVLNRQLVDRCDFGIALFWYRIGTPTPEHQSGSIEEVRRLLGRGSRVLVYFSDAAVPQNALDDDQFDRLRQFKSELQEGALLGSFSGQDHLRQQITLHVTSVVAELLQSDRGQPSPAGVAPNVVTGPMPDVRVRVSAGFALIRSETIDAVSVSVQNHSPLTVFINGISVVLKSSNRRLYAPRDSITGEYLTRRALQSGEGYSFHLDPERLLHHAAVDDLECVAAVDDIGREYRSSREELVAAVRSAAQRRGGSSTTGRAEIGEQSK